MAQIILVIHVIVAIALIGLILIQHGKGADAGAAFGSGASSTVFGSQGSASFMTRLTAGLATAFFLTSLGLAYLTQTRVKEAKDVDVDIPAAAEQEIDKPAVAVPSAPDKPDVPAPATDTADKPKAPGVSDIPE